MPPALRSLHLQQLHASWWLLQLVLGNLPGPKGSVWIGSVEPGGSDPEEPLQVLILLIQEGWTVRRTSEPREPEPSGRVLVAPGGLTWTEGHMLNIPSRSSGRPKAFSAPSWILTSSGSWFPVQEPSGFSDLDRVQSSVFNLLEFKTVRRRNLLFLTKHPHETN